MILTILGLGGKKCGIRDETANVAAESHARGVMVAPGRVGSEQVLSADNIGRLL